MNMCVVFGSYLARFGFVYWLQSEAHIRGDLILGDVHTRGRNTLGSDRTLIVSASPHIGLLREILLEKQIAPYIRGPGIDSSTTLKSPLGL